MLGRWLLALLLVTPALGQEDPYPRPFRVTEPFRPGEVWTTCTGVRTRIARVDRAPLERSIAWTHSALVLDRAQGFALRATLTSVAREERGPGGTRFEVWWEPGEGVRAEDRTWTYELDPTWRLRDVSGQQASFDRLAAEVLDRLGVAERTPATLREELSRDASRAVEAGVIAFADRVGAPVRAVMASLQGAAIRPGQTWRFERAGDWPPGDVVYVGVDRDGHARFRVSWDAEGARTRTADLGVDGGGRVRSFELQDARTYGRGAWSIRLTRELVHGVVRVFGRARPSGRDTATVSER